MIRHAAHEWCGCDVCHVCVVYVQCVYVRSFTVILCFIRDVCNIYLWWYATYGWWDGVKVVYVWIVKCFVECMMCIWCVCGV